MARILSGCRKMDQRVLLLLKNKQKNPVHLDTWQKEYKAWIRVHMDHASIPNVGLFLILVDAYSGWPEIVKVNNRSAEYIIDAVSDI